MSWSRLIDTDFAQRARAWHESDPRRSYHNWHHVERLFWHAKNTFELAWDAELDEAIIGHDVIYDALADKEIRSTEWLVSNNPGATYGARVHVLKTIDHLPSRDNRMVLLDLADMLYPETVDSNFELIRQESQALYGLSDAVFAENNMRYLTGLLTRISPASLVGLPVADRLAFLGIRQGAERAIAIGRRLLADTREPV